MKIYKVIFSLLCIVFVGISFINIKKHKPTPLKFIVPKGWPKPLYNFKQNPLTIEGFELGKKLLDNSGLKITSANDLADAADKIVKAVKVN